MTQAYDGNEGYMNAAGMDLSGSKWLSKTLDQEPGKI